MFFLESRRLFSSSGLCGLGGVFSIRRSTSSSLGRSVSDMKSAPFEDPRAKVENARDHISRVQSTFEEHWNAGPQVRVTSLLDATTYNFGSGQPVPKKVQMAAGDAIHNLRSALDIMAGDVVQASGQSRKGVYFPFAGGAAELDGQIKQKQFHRAAPEAINLLKSLEPYKGGNIALRALHDLDVTDKHNFIIPSAQAHQMNIEGPGFRLQGCTFGGNAVDISLDDRASGEVTPLNISKVTPKLMFAHNVPLAGQEVIPTLHSLADLTLSIIEAFAALFSGRSNPPGSSPGR